MLWQDFSLNKGLPLIYALIYGPRAVKDIAFIRILFSEGMNEN